MSETYPDRFQRFLITAPAMMAVTLVAIDMTIANVALPHMQAAVSASPEQIIWALTSYLLAAAIATPLSGWLAGRFGRKFVMVGSVAGFTVASALCGAANDLETLLFARALQGACGAAMIPLSQAVLLDINPPQNYTKAMAIFSLGSMAGPIVGPTLGGWLTDAFSWRWIFFINIPIGIVSFFGMLAFFPESRERAKPRFDAFGFMTVSIALAAFQLMLDRGEQLDWFDSAEIWIYATLIGLAVYLGTVHIFTARDTFIKPELFKDRNFAVGCAFNTLMGAVIFATLPPIVIMTQSLLNHSAYQTGLVGMPRTIGTVMGILAVGRLQKLFGTKAVLTAGLLITSFSMLLYARMDLYVDDTALLIAGLVQGWGSGLIFVPLSVLTFSTLRPDLRNEGAAMNALLRNIGNAAGISYLQRELTHFTADSRFALVEGVRPDNPMLQYARPDFDFASSETLSRMNQEIGRQASMVGYVELYWLLCILLLAVIPLIFLMRSNRSRTDDTTLPVME